MKNILLLMRPYIHETAYRMCQTAYRNCKWARCECARRPGCRQIRARQIQERRSPDLTHRCGCASSRPWRCRLRRARM